MKGGGCHGGDHLTGYAVKLGQYFLSAPIMSTINNSITGGNFPSVWKCQITHPNFKKGSGSQLDHWRPVRHVQQIGKIAESLIGDQIMNHFINNKLFHKAHHGGVKGLSTFTACAEITDQMMMNNDRGLYSGLLFVDQKSAYDIISHNILLQKNEELQIY